MDILVTAPESQEVTTLDEVLGALVGQRLSPNLVTKSWGDWIHFAKSKVVISIESLRNITSSATIEAPEDTESPDLIPSILKAFASLHWQGHDEDGPYDL